MGMVILPYTGKKKKLCALGENAHLWLVFNTHSTMAVEGGLVGKKKEISGCEETRVGKGMDRINIYHTHSVLNVTMISILL